MAKEMGLDRAPIEFWKLVFLDPPNWHSPETGSCETVSACVNYLLHWATGCLNSIESAPFAWDLKGESLNP